MFITWPKAILLILFTLMIAACSDDEDPEEAPTTEEPVPTDGEAEEPLGIQLNETTYQDFIQIALNTRPNVTFDGFPVGRLAIYTDLDQINDDGETTTAEHDCDGKSSAVTTQLQQAPAEGEADPIYGIAGDFTRVVFAPCTRDGFTHSGTFENLLTTHTEYTEPANIADVVVFTVTDSVETSTFTEYSIINAESMERIRIQGDYAQTTRRESVQQFNAPAERDLIFYIDKVSSTALTINTEFLTQTNINHQFTNFTLSETDETIQWSGTITSGLEEEAYAFNISMPTALSKSLNDDTYTAGNMIITQDMAELDVAFSPDGQATVTLDIDGDGMLEVETSITIAP